MIKSRIDSRQFMKEMNNMMNYSIGFLDGVHSGKNAFLSKLGLESIEMIKQFIDANARVNPAMLHHVYEWYQTGSPAARLYDINYTVSGLGLSFKSSFSQSKSIQDGSKVPFYNKASIMENGSPVTIKPRMSEVLAFEDNGEQVFTRKPIVVANPGGDAVAGSFERTFDLFFAKYFSQAFMKSSGISNYISDVRVFKNNLSKGKSLGRSHGLQTGFRWIANAGVTR